MFNPTTFWSVYAALVAAFITMDILSHSIGYILHWRASKAQRKNQEKMAEELEKAVSEGRLPQDAETLQFLAENAVVSAYQPPMTCSGEVLPAPGQYL